MLDAGFLQAEDSPRHVSLAIGAIAVLAGPMPDFDSLAAGLAERILSVPRFRPVLRTQPLVLGAPQWVDDTNLDITHHPTPDVDELASGIQRAITRLTAVSAGDWRSTPVGTLAQVKGG